MNSAAYTLFVILLGRRMFNPDHFNARERQFIRLYVGLLRDEYFLVNSVLELMSPRNLGVKDIVEATRLAIGLAALHEDFIEQLNDNQKKRGNKRLVKDYPTTDELAELFTLSFFKIVSTTDKQKTDVGFFSGSPKGWKKTFSDFVKHDTTATTANPLDNIMSAYIAAMQKLFPNIKWTTKFLDNNGAWQLPPNSFSPADSEIDDAWLAEDEDDDYWPDDEDEIAE